MSFRSRALHNSFPLPVLRGKDTPPEGQIRDLPQLPTGMDADSEGEEHIKDAVRGKVRNVDIPIPVIKVDSTYDKRLEEQSKFQRSTVYIHLKGNYYFVSCGCADPVACSRSGGKDSL